MHNSTPGRRTVLLGSAVSPPERSVLGVGYREYLTRVTTEALLVSGLGLADVEIGAISYNERNVPEGALAPVVCDALGLVPRPFISISQACAGGGVCADIISAYIESGRYRIGIVLGLNKPDNFDFRDAMGPIGNWTDVDYMLGFTHENYGYLRSEAYKQQYGYDDRVAARWARQCHWYARRNPLALYSQGPLPTEEELLSSTPAGYRARTATGRNLASCLVLASEDVAEELGREPLFFTVGYAHRPCYIGNHYYYTGHPLYREADMSRQPALALAARDAFERARITVDDIDLAQVHDLSSYDGMMALEAMGVVAPGQGGRFVLEGQTAIDGACPTNTDGGAIAFGHSSAGGDFASKVHENFLQLTGRAGERQVPSARTAVAQAYGTHHSLDVVSVLRRQDT
ncbi:MAG: thiolase family protein [Bacillota bacterium]